MNSFPFNWIKPGEIVWCHRCGCTVKLKEMKNYCDCNKNFQTKYENPIEIHEKNWKFIKEIAKLRKLLLPSLFWMKDIKERKSTLYERIFYFLFSKKEPLEIKFYELEKKIEKMKKNFFKNIIRYISTK